MGISHSISKLSREKAERLGEIAKHNDAIKRLRQEIKKIDAVMRMVDAGVDVDAVKPVRTRTPLFRRGELLHLVLVVLKESGRPMTRTAIAAVLEARRSDGRDLHKHVKACTKRHMLNGVFRIVGREPNGEHLYEIMPFERPVRDDRPPRPKLILLGKPCGSC
ncbi:MAG: hypothetical protein AB9900_12925 [Humidesulfovibrio sp.]